MKKINFKKATKRIILILFFSYLIILSAIYFGQRQLQYHPYGKIKDPAEYLLAGFEVEKLTTLNNYKILSWWRKPDDLSKKIIVYFHGNAGNLGGRSNKFKAFAKAGYGVLAVSYSGYYGSEGDLNETSLINNGKAALDFLYKNGYEKKDIILFGESLGSGIAVQLASDGEFFAVILESPYSSIASVGQKKYWFVPVDLLLKDKFESVKYAPKIISPVLIFHGTADRVVSYEEGRKLFAAIKSRKKFVGVEGAGHLGFENKFLIDQMGRFFGGGFVGE